MEIALVLIAVFAVLVAVMAVVWAVRRPAPVVPGQPVAPLFDGTALAQQVVAGRGWPKCSRVALKTKNDAYSAPNFMRLETSLSRSEYTVPVGSVDHSLS